MDNYKRPKGMRSYMAKRRYKFNEEAVYKLPNELKHQVTEILDQNYWFQESPCGLYVTDKQNWDDGF